jgi:TAP42-like family
VITERACNLVPGELNSKHRTHTVHTYVRTGMYEWGLVHLVTKPKIHKTTSSHHICTVTALHIMAEPQNLRALFASAEEQRKELESAFETSSSAYQQSLGAAIATYEECRRFADDLSLFSPNETVDDIPSRELQYGTRFLALRG